MLRTRIPRAFEKTGWRRIGITSPTKGCGKTFVAANLTLSISRTQNNRTILIDMDLRLSALSKVLGVRQTDPARWFVTGETAASETLKVMQATYDPGVVIYDLPPMLSCDDVIGFLPNLDCNPLVAAGDRPGRTESWNANACWRIKATFWASY